jgi:hypothetical protein
MECLTKYVTNISRLSDWFAEPLTELLTAFETTEIIDVTVGCCCFEVTRADR